MASSTVVPTPQQLKALTHPARVRMLGRLRVDGPATATTLARELGLNTGATSYHLRQLAQHGFVEEDVERGNGRDRWWRAAHAATNVRGEVDPETLDAFLQSVVVLATEQLQQAVEERPLLPEAWREASTFSDWVVRLTPARAKALVEALTAVVEGEDDEEAGGEDVAELVVRVNAYPLPGRVRR
ncbi:helix-turn-helix domain-containing protein [Nocardioides sp. SOB77]|uniref:Helix-turn-helix domain-containing protein n=1 Tax=Nocardioides oceani TaxID=3058369 RepID=A0ABT8FFM5_9ACTN|nr:helix-turn-helix domain-containing protein [Nocardioides oceani]MDN4173319.1 helix-turn-helix domain-containing protein [Nocardioides oceani]